MAVGVNARMKIKMSDGFPVTCTCFYINERKSAAFCPFWFLVFCFFLRANGVPVKTSLGSRCQHRAAKVTQPLSHNVEPKPPKIGSSCGVSCTTRQTDYEEGKADLLDIITKVLLGKKNRKGRNQMRNDEENNQRE